MNDNIFDLLVRQVDKDQSGGLSLNEFAVVGSEVPTPSADATASKNALPVQSESGRATTRVSSSLLLISSDNKSGSLSHLSYNHTRIEIERPVIVSPSLSSHSGNRNLLHEPRSHLVDRELDPSFASRASLHPATRRALPSPPSGDRGSRVSRRQSEDGSIQHTLLTHSPTHFIPPTRIGSVSPS